MITNQYYVRKDNIKQWLLCYKLDTLYDVSVAQCFVKILKVSVFISGLVLQTEICLNIQSNTFNNTTHKHIFDG